MSRLEETLKPLLQALMTGASLALTEHDLTRLTEWITLKAMVAERDGTAEPVYGAAERRAFYEARTIPASTRVWLFDCGDGAWASSYVRHAATLASAASFLPEGKNTHTVALGIGRLLVYLIYVRGEEAKFELTMNASACRTAWPATGEISWPPVLRLDARRADDVAHSLVALLRDRKVVHIPNR